MRIRLWGTRGTLPSPGPDTVRYGGNTSCVEIRGRDGTLLVLDAGTGIRRLGTAVEPETTRLDLLLTHLHTDHIQGLGFFRPLYQPDLEVHIWGPPSTTHDLRTRVARYLSPPFFPAHVRDLPCCVTFHDVPRGSFDIGGFQIKSDLVCHPNPTFGYRIAEDAVSIAYLSDHEPALGVQQFPGEPDWTSGFELACGVNLLIHDAQFSDAEYVERVGWGHSSISHAVAFAAATRVERLVTFHHDPTHDDLTLDRLAEQAREAADLPFELVPGTEDSIFEVGPTV